MDSVFIGVMVTNPGPYLLQLVLVAPLWLQVEVVIGRVQHVDSSRVSRISVIDNPALVAVEDTNALPILAARTGVRIVVKRRSVLELFGGEGGVQVKVEIAPKGRHPLEAPAHALFERLYFGERGARNGNQGRVAMVQVRVQSIEIVSPERAMRATFIPIRVKHEMVDDELAAALEELGQHLLAAWAGKRILLFNLLPWKVAPLAVQAVPQPSKLFFLY